MNIYEQTCIFNTTMGWLLQVPYQGSPGHSEQGCQDCHQVGVGHSHKAPAWTMWLAECAPVGCLPLSVVGVQGGADQVSPVPGQYV